MNHDSHYRTLETKGQEPIVRMESIICRGVPEEFHEVAKRNLNMALASKHEDRAGEKSGEDWRKELTKAGNYLHRAVHGCWIGQEAGVKDSLTAGDGVRISVSSWCVGPDGKASLVPAEFPPSKHWGTQHCRCSEVPEEPEESKVAEWIEDENHWTDPETGIRYEAYAAHGCLGCELYRDSACSRLTRHCHRPDSESVRWRKVSE